MGEKSNKAKPNVLWIGVDQMRADTPGANGNEICRTPNIDELADEGVNFTNAYTTCSLCSPSRASMFTGVHAFTHGMGTNCDLYHSLSPELEDPNLLLHHELAEAGYNLGYVGKWHVGTKKGPVDYGFEGMNEPGYGEIKKNRGFLDYLEKNDLSYGEVEKPVYTNPDEKTLTGGIWGGPTRSTPSAYLADYTVELLEEYSEQEEPFFLTCQFWGPHMPHLPSPEFHGAHNRGDIEPWENYRDDFTDKPVRLKRERRDFYRSLPEDWSGWAEIVGLYYDFTTMIDYQVGRIVNRLEELGLIEDTIIVFTSDHGDMTGSHGCLFDKGYMYEEAHRVPLIFRFPQRFGSGVQKEELIYNMDIMPTILDMIGIDKNFPEAESLLSLLAGSNEENWRDELYMEFHGLRALYTQRALLAEDGYKYIFTPGDFDECYDLNSDPAEMNNLIDSSGEEEKIEDLRERVRAAAYRTKDPIRDYVSKLFGSWEDLSGQVDASNQWLKESR